MKTKFPVKTIFALALVLLAPAKSYSGNLLIDSFPGTSLDSNLWNPPISSSGLLKPDDGILEFSTDGTSSASASVSWRQVLDYSSDWEVSVSLSVPVFSGDVAVALGLRVRDQVLGKSFYINLEAYSNASSSPPISWWKLDSFSSGAPPAVYLPDSGTLSVRIGYDVLSQQLISYYQESTTEDSWNVFKAIDVSGWNIDASNGLMAELYAEATFSSFPESIDPSAGYGFSNFAAPIPEPSIPEMALVGFAVLFVGFGRRSVQRPLDT